MVDVNEDNEVVKVKTKQKGGIKSASFRSGGNNGESHRKNSRAKHAKSLKNRAFRADLNARRSSMSASEYHSSLFSLSKGLAT